MTYAQPFRGKIYEIWRFFGNLDQSLDLSLIHGYAIPIVCEENLKQQVMNMQKLNLISILILIIVVVVLVLISGGL